MQLMVQHHVEIQRVVYKWIRAKKQREIFFLMKVIREGCKDRFVDGQ
jgi:hypothetical protein